jgi:hypothetical protein
MNFRPNDVRWLVGRVWRRALNCAWCSDDRLHVDGIDERCTIVEVDVQHRGTLATVISMTGAPVWSGQIIGIGDKIGE